MSIIGLKDLQELASDDCDVLNRFAHADSIVGKDLEKFRTKTQKDAADVMAATWLNNVYTHAGVHKNDGTADYLLSKTIVAYRETFMSSDADTEAASEATAEQSAEDTSTNTLTKEQRQQCQELNYFLDQLPKDKVPALKAIWDVYKYIAVEHVNETVPDLTLLLEGITTAGITADTLKNARFCQKMLDGWDGTVADPVAEEEPSANPAADQPTTQPEIISNCQIMVQLGDLIRFDRLKAFWNIYKNVELEHVGDAFPALSVLISGKNAAAIQPDNFQDSRLCFDILPEWGGSVEDFVRNNYDDAQAALDHVNGLMQNGSCMA